MPGHHVGREARDVAQHSTGGRTVCTTKNYPVQKVSSTKVDKPCATLTYPWAMAGKSSFWNPLSRIERIKSKQM